jgi:hypothetical protein
MISQQLYYPRAKPGLYCPDKCVGSLVGFRGFLDTFSRSGDRSDSDHLRITTGSPVIANGVVSGTGTIMYTPGLAAGDTELVLVYRNVPQSFVSPDRCYLFFRCNDTTLTNGFPNSGIVFELGYGVTGIALYLNGSSFITQALVGDASGFPFTSGSLRLSATATTITLTVDDNINGHATGTVDFGGNAAKVYAGIRVASTNILIDAVGAT